jgi:hypothetical protein
MLQKNTVAFITSGSHCFCGVVLQHLFCIDDFRRLVFAEQNTVAQLPMLLVANHRAGADELVSRNALSVSSPPFLLFNNNNTVTPGAESLPARKRNHLWTMTCPHSRPQCRKQDIKGVGTRCRRQR